MDMKNILIGMNSLATQHYEFYKDEKSGQK